MSTTTWYTVNKWGHAPDAVEVVRETEHFVVLSNRGHERRDAKRSEYLNYFRTYEEARAHTIALCKQDVDKAERDLGSRRERLAAALALSEVAP